MADPKIRYDILANTEGEQDVARLARELEKLDEAIDPAAAARAKALAAEIEALANKRAAVTGFLEALSNSSQASKNLEGAQQALAKLERQLQTVEAPTRAQAGQLQKLQDAAQKAQAAFTQQNESLAKARTTLDQYGVSANELNGAQERLTQSIRATAAQGQQLVTSYRATADAAKTSGREQAAANTAAGATVDQLKSQLQALRNIASVALGGTLLGSLAKDLADTADSYNNLSARIKLATGAGASFDSTFQGVFETAQRTGVAVEEVGNLTTKLVQAGREVNLTAADALRLAEAVAQATQLSGASAQEAASAVTQFSQAIASGRLQGDELRSILENSPRLARALADGLGVTIGQLRELGTQGALTSQQVVTALQGQSAALQREFSELPVTVGRAVTNLGSAWTQYIGQTDQATGASRAAATAIQAVASNLETLANVLYGVGKAAAAYGALRLAETFLASAAGARATAVATVQATAATVAHTAATAANTGAQLANAAATAENAASAGRLAGLLSTLKTFALLGVLTNLKDIGTAIGEGVAKLAGYDKALQQTEATAKGLADAARATAQANAELAQQAQRAADAALGLNKESLALTAAFDGVVLKGGTTADALKAVSKELRFEDVKGVTNAITALDALEKKGKITADQLRETLGSALKGDDLAKFQTLALVAFDKTEQGARRLQAAIDAITDEALRRAGTSVKELQDGFSTAATSAVNDLDAVVQSLKRLGITGSDAGRAVARAVDQATAAAGTQRAVEAVISRIKELGAAGTLAGQQLNDALTKAKTKADELKAGINSVGEALRLFGLKTREELAATAQQLGEAYKVIANDVSLSLAEKAQAFSQYREAAIAANKGVESSEVALQRKILETQLAANGLSESLASGMGRAARAIDQAGNSLDAFEKRLESLRGFDGGVSGTGLAGIGNSSAEASRGSTSPAVQNSGTGAGAKPDNLRVVNGRTLTPPDNSGGWEFVNDAGPGAFQKADSVRYVEPGIGYWRKTAGAAAAAAEVQRKRDDSIRSGNFNLPTQSADGSFSTPQGQAGQVNKDGTVTLNFNFGAGRSYGVTARSYAEAQALARELEQQFAMNGGG